MAKAIFLSEATLKQESILQDNVDMKIVTPTIIDVQSFYILPILGTALYNDFVTKIIAGTLSNSYKLLLDTYITPAMIWYVRYELPLNINYKYFNKAVGVQNADNMQPASIDELTMVMDRAKNKAEWYAERLTKYLYANDTTYPLFLNQPNSDLATIYAKQSNYTSGMLLDDNSCCMGQYNFTDLETSPSVTGRGCTFC
jgi:hypothetical protein